MIVTDRVVSSALKKALRFEVESTTGCGPIYFGNPFCDEVIDHVTSPTLEKALRLKVESRKEDCFRNMLQVTNVMAHAKRT
jgi:hypothetical protein